ncbi:GGDEF domain-containing protein [Mesorhizobium sp. 8]|uniref:GGDEF domain-containing protein n=1 Tax=Mesorhizobium sp. 8 TaxID=2584466 RepID=UPI0015D66328|nr:GGDEF domain-containing protein [Mesorhizobium sp. 8]
MESRRRNYQADWAEAIKLTVFGTASALAVSLLVNYLLLFNDALTPFDRSLLTAFAVPILVGAPLSFLLSRAWTQHRQAERELIRLSSFDRITACLNASTFSTLVERRVKSSQRDDCVFVTVDLQLLRQLMVEHGASCGEEAQQLVAATIQSSVRAGDLVGRIGDGQFGVLLQNVTEVEATGICQRIREKVSEVYFAPSGKPLALDVRVAGINIDAPASFDALFRAANRREASIVLPKQTLLSLSHAASHIEH